MRVTERSLLVRSLVLLLLTSVTTACTTGVPKHVSSISGDSDYTESRVLVLTLQGTTPDKVVGAVDVMIEMPQGASVKAQNNGLIKGGVLLSSLTSNSPVLAGRFSNGILHVAMISPSEIKGGEIMRIHTDVAKNVPLQAESFRIKSMQAIDLKGTTVNGVGVTIALQ
jgi:hypothetical protein